MIATIYIIPEKGDGVPEVWKEFEVETGDVTIPAHLFHPDVAISITFSEQQTWTKQ